MDTKKNLAYAYQILGKLGLDDHTYTHLSARPEGADYYFIYPFGLRFEEVTEDNLLKVSLDGTILEGEECQYNKTGYVIHGNIYKNRDDINAIFHLHTEAGIAVASMKEGLLPISQWALHFYGQIAFHEYNSLALDEDEHGGAFVRDMGEKNVVLMRNHGFLTAGKTIHEAMFYCHHLQRACATQVAALSCNRELVIPDEEVCRKANQDLLTFEKDLGKRDWDAWVRWIENKTSCNDCRKKKLKLVA